ncbi:MAG TPA: glycosyltransferase family 39 protein [Xanthobacteraceae bacterium]
MRVNSVRNIEQPARATDWPARLLDAATTSHRRALAILAALCLLAFLPGFFTIPPVDRDEARFAQASKQMVESGDYVDIRFGQEVRYKKPVGIYWLQAGVVRAGEALGVPQARTSIWLYRIPSLIGAIAAVLLTYWAALAFGSRRVAVLAAAMLATSILLGVEARLAKTDAVLLACCIAAMGALARLYLGSHAAGSATERWRLPLILWTALAAGVLVKGPLILLFTGLTVAALAVMDRSLAWIRGLRVLPGTLWMLVLVLPWFVMIALRSHGAFFTLSVGDDMLAKVASGQESHGAPPGTYLLLFWVTFFPASVVTALAAARIFAQRREPRVRFLLAWIVPAWIVLELVITKLPHYVLPLYPAVAILTAIAIDERCLSHNRLLVVGAVWWLIVPCLLAALTVVAPYWLGLVPSPIAVALAAGGIAVGYAAWRRFTPDAAEDGLLHGIAAMLLAGAAVYHTLPRLTPIFPSPQLAQAVRGAGCDNASVAAVGFQEPSLVFLAGTQTLLADPVSAAIFLREGGCRFALVEGRQQDFERAAAAHNVRYTTGPTVSGYGLGNGKPVRITLYRAAENPPPAAR